LPGAWSSALPHALTDPDKLFAELRQGAFEAASMLEEERPEEPPSDGGFRAELSAGMEPVPFLSLDQRLNRMRGARFGPDVKMRLLHAVERQEVPAIDEGNSDEVVAVSLGLNAADLDIVAESAKSAQTSLVHRLRSDPVAAELVWFSAPDKLFRQHHHLTRNLLANVAETVDINQQIAAVAAEHRVRVRWFDFEPFEAEEAPSGGYRNLLHPLDAVEHTRPRADKGLALFLSLRLTEQNVASLIFQRPETEEPGVLFLADSRLAFGIDRPEESFPNDLIEFERPFIFTAPHHGSRNNDRAYEVLRDEWLAPEQVARSYAVRNGGVWNQTLAGYLNQPNRRCARCYQCHGGDWGQVVCVEAQGGDWDWAAVYGNRCGTPKPKQPRKPKK
jgi:hypothetical protein